MNPLQAKNFLPIDIDVNKLPMRLKWLDVREDLLDQLSFDLSVQVNISNGNPDVIETSLSELLTVSGNVDFVRPSGFIYHMSRCGSTLVSNMFKQLRKNIVLTEPVLPLKILELLNEDNQEYIGAILKGAIEMMGRRRFGCEENMVIKFFSGATYFIPFLLKVFPDVPRIYIYRDPVEVLVSNLKQADQFWIYNSNLTGRSTRQMVEEYTPLENCAYALAGKSEAFLKHYDQNCLIVDYNQINRAFLERLIGHFNMTFNEQEIGQMMKAMTYNAKETSMKFALDKDQKQQQASPKVRAVAERILGPVHEKLKQLTIRL